MTDSAWTPPEEPSFLRALVEGMRCGIVIIDSDGRLVLLNENARQILELPEAPAVGAPILEALSQHPRLSRALLESFRTTSLPNRAEVDLGVEPGEGKTIGFTISMVASTDGGKRGAAMFFKDLTPIEHREEQERLRGRLAALGQMAASVAHEIRNPLAAIEVNCTLLRRRLGADDKGRDLVEKVAAEVRRLNRNVNSSLEFVRPVRPEFHAAELVPLLEEAITVASGRRGKPGVRVHRRFRDGLDPFLMDRSLLRQVFVNLILNAMEAVGEEGTITVEAKAIEAPGGAGVPYVPVERAGGDPWHDCEKFVVVRIADTGPGIDPDDRDRIFYPFFTTKKQGSGVGLATVKKIVDSHRGLIDVDTAASSGAVFTIRLPMVLNEPEVPEA